MDDVSDGLRAMGLGASKLLYPEIRKAIRPYRSEIKRSAPLGPTGNLRKGNAKVSITRKGIFIANTESHAHLVYGAIGRAGKSAPYGPPNPFLHRAVGRRRPEITTGIAKALEEFYAKAAAASVAVGA